MKAGSDFVSGHVRLFWPVLAMRRLKDIGALKGVVNLVVLQRFRHGAAKLK
jgi:hypothetical protein